MNMPSYFDKYKFDWEVFDVIIGGKSGLDANSFLGPISDLNSVEQFLTSYGFDPKDPVVKAELFGSFQEALQFIKVFFLKEGGHSYPALDLTIPRSILSITDVTELFIKVVKHENNLHLEESIWAAIVLKVMHTILHVDRDLRNVYFQTIQQQVFDRFYKYLGRDKDDQLFLGLPEQSNHIPIFDYSTKAKKSRNSIIIKLLHKPENVAEELFDQIGIRFITHNKLDTLRVVKFLQDHNIIVAHNVKPSRSLNTLIDLNAFKLAFANVLSMAQKNHFTEDQFTQTLEKEIKSVSSEDIKNLKNTHTKSSYRSIQFTGRQLIIYKNPILSQISDLKILAGTLLDNPLEENVKKFIKKINLLDLKSLPNNLRFFYPFEVQIVDKEMYLQNTSGKASHEEYKKSQIKSAMNRLFKSLFRLKKINLDF